MTRFFHKNEKRSLCILNYRFQISDIVSRNLNAIFNYSEKRRNEPEFDLNLNIAPLAKVSQGQFLNINLSIFTDGVSIKKSTNRREVWPIWVQITDLPPVLRMARKNIVLAALYVGSGVPDWTEIVPQIRAELLTPVEVFLNSEVPLAVRFRFNLLVSDLGAKSHLLNMYKFNGNFGGNFCTVNGVTIGRTHSYYPYSQSSRIREAVLTEKFIEIAEDQQEDESVNAVGVKGRSAFASIVDNLPLSAPIDYMHCVLLGVFPETLKICQKSISVNDRKLISSEVSQLSCPREMISYSRKIRSIEEIGQFKANGYFNWLLYISPLAFHDRLEKSIYSHLVKLVFSVRLLLESSSADNISIAEKHLDHFCAEIVNFHEGNKKIETINVHSLRHLLSRFVDSVHCSATRR